jgi:hypothetical protein
VHARQRNAGSLEPVGQNRQGELVGGFAYESAAAQKKRQMPIKAHGCSATCPARTIAFVKRPTSVPPQAKTTKYTLIMFQNGPEPEMMSRIDRHLVSVVQRELDEKIKSPRNETELEVWLESPGGDAHSAYKLALDLRARARSLKVVIPDYAKSAATLFALGMDVIYMAAAAELGPLDVQIEHPDREGMIISALDVVGAIDFLGRTAITLTLSGGASALRYTDLSRSEVLRDMLTFSADFVRPAVSKLDPHLLQKASRELDVAKKYAIDLLGQVHPSRRSNVGDPERLVHRLVREYKAHGFAISRDEIKRLGLLPEPAESHPRWPLIRRLHRISEDEEKPMLTLATEAELDEMASSMQNEDNDDESEDADAASDAEPRSNAAPPAPGSGEIDLESAMPGRSPEA